MVNYRTAAEEREMDEAEGHFGLEDVIFEGSRVMMFGDETWRVTKIAIVNYGTLRVWGYMGEWSFDGEWIEEKASEALFADAVRLS